MPKPKQIQITARDPEVAGAGGFQEDLREPAPHWTTLETLPLGDDLPSEDVKFLQQSLYAYDRDVGNYGQQEKYDSLLSMLSQMNPAIDEVDQTDRDQYIKSLLVHMGEMDTYSIAEGVVDVAGPVIGAAAGAVAGGAAGSVIPGVGTTAGTFAGLSTGSAVAAGTTEVLKMNWERHQRGISLMSVDEMVSAGLPIAVADMIFSLGVPLLARMKLGASRKMLLPGSPFKGSVKKIPQTILESQQVLKGQAVQRPGIYAALTDRLRYGPGGAKASLLTTQLNAGQENFVSTIAEMTGDSLMGKGTVTKRFKETFQTAQQAALDLMHNIGEQKGWGAVGRILDDSVKGEIKLGKLTRDTLWADARRHLKGKNIGVSTGVLTDFFEEKSGKRFLKPEMQKLEKRIINTLSDEGKLLDAIPPAIDATDALDLWNTLNALRGNADFGKQAGHLAREIREVLFKRVKETTHGRHHVPGASGLSPYDRLVKARDYHIAYKETFESDLMKSMLKSIKSTPEAVEGFIYAGGGTRESKLLAFKNAIPFKEFQEKILPPLRYTFMNDATEIDRLAGKIMSPKIVKAKLKDYGAAFDDNGKLSSVGPYLNDVFGGKEAVGNMIKNMDAIEAAMSGAGGTKILMKMVEATVFMGITQNPIKEAAPGVVSFIITPFMLASGVFTNRRLMRELTDGMIGHKPIEHTIMTVARLFEKANRDWTDEQVVSLTNYFKAKAEELSEGAAPPEGNTPPIQ